MGTWAGSDENIARRQRDITPEEAEHAALNILGAIGHDEYATIHGFMAVEAVAGLRAFAELRRGTNNRSQHDQNSVV